MSKRRKKERRLLYAFARLLLNPRKLALNEWGVKGLMLLAKLRNHNPKRYEKLVKQWAEKKQSTREA